jgi:hypothetical protein
MALSPSDFGDTEENAFGQQTMIDFKQQQKHILIYIYL